MKKKKGKHLIVQIEAIEMGGEYEIITTQLSNIPIPLTEFEKTYSSPFKNKPITNKNLKQAIEENKKYIQQRCHTECCVTAHSRKAGKPGLDWV